MPDYPFTLYSSTGTQVKVKDTTTEAEYLIKGFKANAPLYTSGPATEPRIVTDTRFLVTPGDANRDMVFTNAAGCTVVLPGNLPSGFVCNLLAQGGALAFSRLPGATTYPTGATGVGAGAAATMSVTENVDGYSAKINIVGAV